MMKTQLMLVLLLMLSSTFSFAQETRPPIIDMHQHAMPVDFWGTPDPDWFSQLHLPPRAKNEEELITRTFAVMDTYNVVLAVFSGGEQYVDRWFAYDSNRVVRGTNIASSCDAQTMEYLRRLHAEKGYEVMGELSWQYRGISVEDDELIPCFELARELDLPMGIHMGMAPPGWASRGRYRAALGSPLLLEKRLKEFPDLRIYIMHAGWPMLDETIALMHNYGQVYADLCWINSMIPRKEFYYYLERLVNAGLGDRLMFGSDAGAWPDVIRLSIEAIEEANFLTEQQKRDIFYNNAARFLRLKEPEETFKADIALAPNNPYRYDSYGDFLFKARKYNEAIENFIKAFEKNPEFTYSLIKAGNINCLKGDYKTARATYKRFYDASNDGKLKMRSLFWQSVTYIYENNMTEALKLYDEYQSIAEQDKRLSNYRIWAYANFGDIHTELGDPAEGLKYYKKAIDLIDKVELGQSEKEKIIFNSIQWQANALIAQGELDQAKETLKKNEQQGATKKDEAKEKTLNIVRARLAMAEGNDDAALELLSKADASNPMTVYYQAIIYEKKGDKDKASELYKKIEEWTDNSINLAFIRNKMNNKL